MTALRLAKMFLDSFITPHLGFSFSFGGKEVVEEWNYFERLEFEFYKAINDGSTPKISYHL